MTIKRYAGDRFTGLSSDTKPTAVPDGAIFLEIDTGAPYYLNNATWSAYTSSGSGNVFGIGSISTDTVPIFLSAGKIKSTNVYVTQSQTGPVYETILSIYDTTYDEDSVVMQGGHYPRFSLYHNDSANSAEFNMGRARSGYTNVANGDIICSINFRSQSQYYGTSIRIIGEVESDNVGGNGYPGGSLKIITRDTSTSAYGSSGTKTAVTVHNAGNVDFGSNVDVSGHLTATTKSFLIDHPSNPSMKLQYASLEGPEHGVYYRGKNDFDYVYLPYYWKDLIDENTITVQVTATDETQRLFVSETNSHFVTVKGHNNLPYYYTIYAERKDVGKLIVEY